MNGYDQNTLKIQSNPGRSQSIKEPDTHEENYIKKVSDKEHGLLSFLAKYFPCCFESHANDNGDLYNQHSKASRNFCEKKADIVIPECKEPELYETSCLFEKVKNKKEEKINFDSLKNVISSINKENKQDKVKILNDLMSKIRDDKKLSKSDKLLSELMIRIEFLQDGDENNIKETEECIFELQENIQKHSKEIENIDLFVEPLTYLVEYFNAKAYGCLTENASYAKSLYEKQILCQETIVSVLEEKIAKKDERSIDINSPVAEKNNSLNKLEDKLIRCYGKLIHFLEVLKKLFGKESGNHYDQCFDNKITEKLVDALVKKANLEMEINERFAAQASYVSAIKYQNELVKLFEENEGDPQFAINRKKLDELKVKKNGLFPSRQKK